MRALIHLFQLVIVVSGATLSYCVLARFSLLGEPVPLWAWLVAAALTVGLANSLFSLYRPVPRIGRILAAVAFYATWIPICAAAASFGASHVVATTPQGGGGIGGYFWILFVLFSSALVVSAACLSRHSLSHAGS